MAGSRRPARRRRNAARGGGDGQRQFGGPSDGAEVAPDLRQYGGRARRRPGWRRRRFGVDPDRASGSGWDGLEAGDARRARWAETAVAAGVPQEGGTAAEEMVPQGGGTEAAAKVPQEGGTVAAALQVSGDLARILFPIPTGKGVPQRRMSGARAAETMAAAFQNGGNGGVSSARRQRWRRRLCRGRAAAGTRLLLLRSARLGGDPDRDFSLFPTLSRHGDVPSQEIHSSSFSKKQV